jgi:hypothetical protein
MFRYIFRTMISITVFRKRGSKDGRKPKKIKRHNMVILLMENTHKNTYQPFSVSPYVLLMPYAARPASLVAFRTFLA